MSVSTVIFQEIQYNTVIHSTSLIFVAGL